jgi:hypothetical protein
MSKWKAIEWTFESDEIAQGATTESETTEIEMIMDENEVIVSEMIEV